MSTELREGTKFTAAANTAAGTNASAAITFAASPGKTHYLHNISCSYSSGVVSGGRMWVSRALTAVVWDLDITATGTYSPIIPTISSGRGSALMVSLAAGGAAGIEGQLNAYKFTK